MSGAHWAALQVTAWTGMLVTRSQEAGMVEAMKTTFDGAHPCAMCSAIEKEKNGEQQKSAAISLRQAMEIQCVAMEGFTLPIPMQQGDARWVEFLIEDCWRTDAPPTPPPLA